MDIAALKTVLTVQTHGSIAGAARALDLDPSSVSRIVATVETGIGVRLFQRTTRRLTVTDEGRVYLSRIAPLLEELDAAQEEAAGARRQTVGHLRLTASVAFTTEVLVKLLPDFQRAYPRITVELQSSDANLDLVENGIDLAIRLAPAPQGDMVSTRLATTRYRVVASPDLLAQQPPCSHPLDLEGRNCLRHALPDLRDTWYFRKAGVPAFNVPVDGSPLISSPLALRQAAVDGLGYALLANWLIARDLAVGRLVDVFPDYDCTASDFDTAAWLLYPNRRHLPRKVRVMIDFLKDHVRQFRP